MPCLSADISCAAAPWNRDSTRIPLHEIEPRSVSHASMLSGAHLPNLDDLSAKPREEALSPGQADDLPTIPEQIPARAYTSPFLRFLAASKVTIPSCPSPPHVCLRACRVPP